MGLLLALAVTAVLLFGCSEDTTPRQASVISTRAPDLGGPAPTPRAAPEAPMNDLEKPVAERLAAQVRDQGLDLEYLDCPHWDGAVPSRMTCRGYVDGVVASVGVELTSAVGGRAVSFDARLEGGVIATRGLVETLRGQSWSQVDCGDIPAYPATPGTRIVCRVSRHGAQQYVVATVQDRSGAVTITGY